MNSKKTHHHRLFQLEKSCQDSKCKQNKFVEMVKYIYYNQDTYQLGISIRVSKS